MKKTLIKVCSVLFPNAMVKIAMHHLMNPQVKKLRKNEDVVLDTAEKVIFRFKSFDIQTYHWKGKGKAILLIHGWEGQAGNFANIIPALIKDGYDVYAFDAPSHGYSSKGSTSVFEFSELSGKMIDLFKPKKLISHSFGGVATTFALQERPHLLIEKYVLLTTPDKFSERIQDISDKVGVTDKVRLRLIKQLETKLNISVTDANVSDAVQNIQVNSALIIHDKNDKVIPLNQSEKVAKKWKVCQLEVVEGTGHFRILKDESVIKRLIQFLKD